MPSTRRSPRVSVIIPAHNRAWALPRAIDSVFEQDDTDFELLIVDDGSTDETPQLLSAYGERVTVITQPNRGVSAARNHGIAASSGELIAFLDSDDYWLPGKLSRQVSFFDDHPEALICQTQEIWVRRGRRVNPKNRHAKPSGMIFEPSLELCLVSPSAVMVRRSLFDQAGLFDESMPACEDYDLWLRISAHHPVHLIDEPLIVKQGGHEDQLSAAPCLDKYRIYSIDKILRSGILSKSQRLAAISMLVQKCRIYAAGCRKRGRDEEADGCLKLSEYWNLNG